MLELQEIWRDYYTNLINNIININYSYKFWRPPSLITFTKVKINLLNSFVDVPIINIQVDFENLLLFYDNFEG